MSFGRIDGGLKVWVHMDKGLYTEEIDLVDYTFIYIHGHTDVYT